MDRTGLALHDLLMIYGSVPTARERIRDATGVDIPYTTLNHWRNGRMDFLTIERAIAIKKFFHLSDDEFLAVMKNSKSK
jgi:hypothetical protein